MVRALYGCVGVTVALLGHGQSLTWVVDVVPAWGDVMVRALPWVGVVRAFGGMARPLLGRGHGPSSDGCVDMLLVLPGRLVVVVRALLGGVFGIVQHGSGGL